MTQKSVTSGTLFFCDVDISIAILNITCCSRDARATHLAILPSQGMGMKSTQRWILAFCLYFLILLTIIVLAYRGILPVKISAIPFYDTIGHFILLGIASYLAHKSLGKRMIKTWPLAITLPLGPILVTIFAIVDESLQMLSPLRTSTLSDLVANLVGIWFFYWLASR